jgi:hypothetical protein
MDKSDQEIMFSRTVKSGKRIYYLDAKKNRRGDFFIAITESKKVINNDTDVPQVTFEKHKIFLYKEDIEKFMEGLMEVVSFVNENEDTIENEDILIDSIQLKVDNFNS